MTEFPHDSIKPFSHEGPKKAQVSEMFDRIAPRYDFMNRLLSLGIDRQWRRKAIHLFQKDKPQRLLDVATGTGDMAILSARMLQPQAIIGIDISEGMLEKGREKIKKEGLSNIIELHSGDGETISFETGLFDGVTVAFGVRNFENLQAGLREIFRVMKPGAQVVVLEFSKPRFPVIKQVYHFYMGHLAPQLAKWFNQNKKAYQYLNESAKAFPDREPFLQILQQVGFSNARYRSLTFGICCLYSARKPG